MNRILFLKERSAAVQFLFLIGMIILFTILFGLSGLLIGKLWLHTDMETLSSYLNDPHDAKARSFLYFYQFFNQSGVFFIPSLFFLWLATYRPGVYLGTNKTPKAISLFLAFLMIYTILPFVNYLTEINRSFVFPHGLQFLEEWLKQSEQHADKLTKVFLSVSTPAGLILNLFIVALIPALGEELLFRGLMQRILVRWTRNTHVGVVVAAILFSALHMQFYGFLPRFALGLLLGYLFVYTGNLWVPIFAHFVNNASSVIIFYLHYNGFIKVKMEDFGATPNGYYIVGSMLITLWLFSILYQKEGVALRNSKI